MSKKKFAPALRVSVAVSALVIFPGQLFSQGSFYSGKTITIIQGRQPGGTGDLRVRAAIPFLQKYISGNPAIVTEFIPGGGGRKAANHTYRVARPDGLTIANIGAGFVSNAILGEPGVQYDVDKFIYLGSGNSRTSYVFLTKRELGLASMEKLQTASGIRIGAQSVGHDIYINGRLFAWLLGLKDAKFVTGYSGPEVDLALMRGEVDARANIADTVLQRTPEWIEKGIVHLHAILEIPRGFRADEPALKRLPSLDDFATTEIQKKVLQMFRNFRLIGSPFLLPSKTPKDRAEILQEAFRKTFKDPEFLKSWEKLTGAEASPLMPEEQETAVREIPRDPQAIEVFKKIAGADPLPTR